MAPLHSPWKTPEKILGMGTFGCGKTTAYLKLAAKLWQTKSDATMYILDTDDAVEGMVEQNPLYRRLTNLQITTAYEYPEYLEWVEKTRAVVKPTDWIIVDFIDYLWDEAQRHYMTEVFGKGSGSYFLELKKAQASNSDIAKEFGPNWQFINKVYFEFAQPLLKRTRANIYGVSKIEEVKDDEKNKEIRQMFGSAKVKPTGQKHLGFPFRTIIVFSKIGFGEQERYIYTTIKDRERELQRNHPCSSFVNDYLMEIAGWNTNDTQLPA